MSPRNLARHARDRPDAASVPLGRDPAPRPHVCDYRESDGTTAGACHLFPPHGGRCPLDQLTASDCRHQAAWETQLLCSVRECEVHR